MSNGYRVDMGALERAAAGVNGTLDQVAQESVSDIPHDESSFGHEGLSSSVSDFLGRWQRGVNNLTSDGREIAARLTTNVTNYRRAEKTNKAMIINGILTGTGSDPGEH